MYGFGFFGYDHFKDLFCSETNSNYWQDKINILSMI